MIPAHNNFTTLRQRLGRKGFVQLHQHFVLEAYDVGLLAPPIPDLLKMARGKIILMADSTFLKAVASTKGEKGAHRNWLFTDASIAFAKPHHKHKYPVGHRAHTLTAVSGVPIAGRLAPAKESDKTYILPLLHTAITRYLKIPFICVILDAGYDPQGLLFSSKYRNSKSPFAWMSYTYFKDDYRRQGAAVPGSRLYKRLKKLRTGIEYYTASLSRTDILCNRS